jgi:hypothetical protein
MWDLSSVPAAGSKWRRVTAAQQARADATDKRLRLETQALEAGSALPVQSRRIRDRPSVLVPPVKAEIAGLWAFLSRHGREIAPLLARAANEDQQLRLARSFRDLRSGATGAYERWVIVLRELDR